MKKTLLLLFLAASMVASAQMIGATNSQGTYRPADNTPAIRPTGPALRLGLATPYVSLAFDYHITPYIMAGVGVGYGGAMMSRYQEYYRSPVYSYDWYCYRTEYTDYYDIQDCIPLYLEAEVHTPGAKWSVFLNVKVGYNMTFNGGGYYSDGRETNSVIYAWEQYTIREEFKDDPLFFCALVGVGYKNFNLGIGYSKAPYAIAAEALAVNLSYDLPIATLRRWLMF